MICATCYKDLTKPSHRERNVYGGVNTFYCNDCKEEFIVWEDMCPGCWAMEKGEYRIYCDPTKNVCQIQKVYMDIESDTSIMYRWYTILELNAIPQGITDANFEEKIKTYLLFS